MILSSPGTGGTLYSLFHILYSISQVPGPSPKSQSQSLDKKVCGGVGGVVMKTKKKVQLKSKSLSFS